MTTNGECFKCAFLVDVSSSQQNGDYWKEAICLCVFRTLSFLNSRHSVFRQKVNSKIKSLKWGFKLFDSTGHQPISQCHSCSFKDFKTKTVDEFEIELLNIQIDNRNTSDSLSQKLRSSSSRRTEASTCPAKNFSKCLTESLHDFPWEILEIGSPVKGSKNNEEKKASSADSNLIFIISPVPCDRKAMRQFSNKVVIDNDVFLDSFLPCLLKNELLDQRNVKLFWIDAGRYNPPEAKDTVRVYLIITDMN